MVNEAEVGAEYICIYLTVCVCVWLCPSKWNIITKKSKRNESKKKLIENKCLISIISQWL